MNRLSRKNVLTVLLLALAVSGCAKGGKVRPDKEKRADTPPPVETELPLDYGKVLRLKAIRRDDLAALLADKLANACASRMKPRFYNSERGITDIESSVRRADIKRAVSSGLMDIFPDGSFHPEDIVQRAHFAIIVQNILTPFGQARLMKPGTSPYKDVPRTYYAYNAILLATQKDIIDPRSPGVFAPFEPLSGEEAVEAIDRLKALLR